MATGKEQKITISGTSGLSKDEVDRLVKEAQSHASEDQARRDLIEARNQADTLAHEVQATVNENREKLPVGELSKIDAAIANVRKVAQDDDLVALRRAIAELTAASHAIAKELYGAAAAGPRTSSGSGRPDGSQGSTVKEAEVVDAEYADSST
jgi:molecular chaperone DnaK